MVRLPGSILARRALIAGSAAVIALGVAAPSYATITIEAASGGQGTLVHGVGPEVTAFDVIANLGSGGPNIVHFTGDTDETANTSDLLRLQGGTGQADITGAEISPGGNPEGYDFFSGNIFLTGNAGMTWIELALTGTNSGGTVDFYLTDGLGNIHSFLDQVMGSGNTQFGFQATGLDVITNLRFVADSPPTSIDLVKQVRITTVPGAVPEPATWAMMLIGFGAMGVSLRQRRRNHNMPQVA